MKQHTKASVPGNTVETIFILAVVAPGHAAQLERILSHTRWQLHVVHSAREATKAMRAIPVSVVLCEDRLPDGTWLDVVRETEQFRPLAQTIVLSSTADSSLWAEVLNCGGYDLLAMPVEPKELYMVVPMAWRQSSANAQASRCADDDHLILALTAAS